MKTDNLFRSWKEIASYLGCDIRTCLRWEKSLGLPVHRVEGGSKGTVFAYQEELDRWITEKSRQNGRNGESSRTGEGTLEGAHKKAFEEGRVRSVLDDAYFETLGKGVRYWDGAARKWSAVPAMSNPW